MAALLIRIEEGRTYVATVDSGELHEVHKFPGGVVYSQPVNWEDCGHVFNYEELKNASIVR